MTSFLNKKRCSKCKIEYPATTKYFYKRADKQANSRISFRSWCKKCLKEYSERPENKIHKKEYNKKYAQSKKGKAIKLYYKATIVGHLSEVFYNIKQRCNNPKRLDYRYYGGRGIKCLFESPYDFIFYIINVLKIDPRGLDVDRIDNDGNYEVGNIRFVTHNENCKNRRRPK